MVQIYTIEDILYLQHKGVQNKASAGLRTITQRIENVKS